MTTPAQAKIPAPHRRRRGFTLIELMITVAIIAILARIALPAYLNYTKRGKLTEAFNQMSACSLALGQYYQDNRSYSGATVGTTSAATCASSTSNFSYTLTGLSATAYLLTATGSTTPVTNFTFTLDNNGNRATTNVPSGWTNPGTACWVNSPSGCQ